MDSDELISVLAEHGVIEDKREFQLSEAFLDCITTQRKHLGSLEGGELRRTLVEAVSPDDERAELAEIAVLDHRFGATLSALHEFLPGFDQDTLRDVALSFYLLTTSVPRTEGSPSQFVPVEVAQLDLILRLFPRCILYVWRDDCEPCEIMREEFDEIFTTQPEDLGLFSVYGPDGRDQLEKRFNVVGGPTTLFMYQGRVFSRFYGAQYQDRILTEIEALRQQEDRAG